MELLQLRYFIALAEHQHMTKTSQTIHVSQPSLSNSLSRIEHELGAKLFDREGRNIVLNENGKIALTHAKAIFREIDNMKAEITDNTAAQRQTIVIGAADSTYTKDWLPDLMRAHPEIHIRHLIASSSQLEKLLNDGSIDFGITDSPTLPPHFDRYFLGNDDIIVSSLLASPLSKESPQDFANFRNEPFICTPKTEGVLRLIDMLQNAAGFNVNIVFEGEPAMLTRVFPLGYGHVVASRSKIDSWQMRPKELRISRPVYLTNDYATYSVHCIWDRRRALTKAKKCLIAYLEENVSHFHQPGKGLNPIDLINDAALL